MHKNLYLKVLTAVLFSAITSSSWCSSSINNLEFKQVSQDPPIYNYAAANQLGADCGFHAVKNATALYNNLDGKINKQQLQKLLASSSVGNLTMQQCKIATLKQTKSRSIETQEVYKVAELIKFPKKNISVLADLDTLILTEKERRDRNKGVTITQEEYDKLADLIIHLKQEAPATHAFALGTMSAAQKIKSGHYIAVVAHKPKGTGKPISFHMADSIASARKNPTYNIKLVKMLQKVLQRDPIELKTITIAQLMIDMRTNMAYTRYEAALKNIREIILSAQRNGMIQNPHFKTNKQEIINTLNQIIDTNATSTIKRQAEETLDAVLNDKKTLSLQQEIISQQEAEQLQQAIALSQQQSQIPMGTLISFDDISQSKKPSHSTQRQTFIPGLTQQYQQQSYMPSSALAQQQFSSSSSHTTSSAPKKSISQQEAEQLQQAIAASQLQAKLDLQKRHQGPQQSHIPIGQLISFNDILQPTKPPYSTQPQKTTSTTPGYSSQSFFPNSTATTASYTANDLFETFDNFQPNAQKAQTILKQKPALANTPNISGIKPLNFIAGIGPIFFNPQNQQTLLKIAQMLINSGAAINGRDSTGKTPLMSAMETANDAMVALLLQNGADVTLQNNSGKLVINDAIEVAKKQPQSDIVGDINKVRNHIKHAIAQWQKRQNKDNQIKH